MTLPVNVVTPLLETVRCNPGPKNCGVCSRSASTPRRCSLSSIDETPNVTFFSPTVGSPRAMLVSPANLIPIKGTISRSVCARAGAGANKSKPAAQLATLRRARAGGIQSVLANEQAEERPGEERRGDVAVLQGERCAEAVAVSEQDQRQVAVGNLEN